MTPSQSGKIQLRLRAGAGRTGVAGAGLTVAGAETFRAGLVDLGVGFNVMVCIVSLL